MAHADFVHLRVHSPFSLSEGAIKIDALVALCREHRMPAVAITDTGNLFGAMQFSEACMDFNLISVPTYNGNMACYIFNVDLTYIHKRLALMHFREITQLGGLYFVRNFL